MPRRAHFDTAGLTKEVGGKKPNKQNLIFGLVYTTCYNYL